MAVRGRRRLRWHRARRLVQERRPALLALTASACFVAAVVSGWSVPPATPQIIAAVCGCALTFGAYIAGQQPPPAAALKKNARHFDVRQLYSARCETAH